MAIELIFPLLTLAFATLFYASKQEIWRLLFLFIILTFGLFAILVPSTYKKVQYCKEFYETNSTLICKEWETYYKLNWNPIYYAYIGVIIIVVLTLIYIYLIIKAVEKAL